MATICLKNQRCGLFFKFYHGRDSVWKREYIHHMGTGWRETNMVIWITNFYFLLGIILIACFACKNYMCSLFLKFSSKTEKQRVKKKKIPQSNLVSWIIFDNEESILPTLSLCPNKIGVAISVIRLHHKWCSVSCFYLLLNISWAFSEKEKSNLWHLRAGLVLQLELDVLLLNINNFTEHQQLTRPLCDYDGSR